MARGGCRDLGIISAGDDDDDDDEGGRGEMIGKAGK